MEIAEPKIDELREMNEKPKGRPAGFSILLIFSFVYNGILFALMFAGLLYPDVIREVVQQYFQSAAFTNTASYFFTSGAMAVFAVSLAGLILMWMMRRTGFYLYATGQVIMLAVLVFFLKSYDIINLSIALVIVIIFGLYSRGMK